MPRFAEGRARLAGWAVAPLAPGDLSRMRYRVNEAEMPRVAERRTGGTPRRPTIRALVAKKRSAGGARPLP